MAVRFNAPPGWPAPPPSWTPTDGWMPDPGWPTPPADWEFWTVVERRAVAPTEPPRSGMPPRSTVATYGTDRGSWLAGLRAQVTGQARVADARTGEDRADVEPVAVVERSRQLDHLLSSAGR